MQTHFSGDLENRAMEKDQSRGFPPHVLILPFPVQGHVNSMLKLAELLCLAGGIDITFLLTSNNHDRLLRHTNLKSRFSKYPGIFHVEAIPEEEDPLKGDWTANLFDSFHSAAKLFLEQLLISRSGNINGSSKPPITSIIADGILSSITLDAAQRSGVPIISFRTISTCSFWAYFSIPQLIEAGELPFTDYDLDTPIASVKGMEDFLRRRDLPSFCRVESVDDLVRPEFKMVLSETQLTPRARGFILNTFEDLEGPILAHVRTQCPNIYSIGPLHAHLKSRLAAKSSSPQSISSNSLWEEDRSCISWLDEQPPKSVLYVSFGSSTKVTRDQFLEFWHGLVNSGVRFLWVVRRDSNAAGGGKYGESKTPEELELDEATKARGCMVGWAPQEEVLGHPAVGCFLTHNGWNSTLESIVEGVPMICWPYFADQQINSRFVEHIWKIGLDMKDTCDRVIIEKMIRDVMEVRRDNFLQRAEEMAKLAGKAVKEGGTSSCNLDRLIEDIKLMSIPSNTC